MSDRNAFLRETIRRILTSKGMGDFGARQSADEIMAVVPSPEVIGNLAQAAMNVVFGWEDRPKALNEALIWESGAEPLISYGDLRTLRVALEAYAHRGDIQ